MDFTTGPATRETDERNADNWWWLVVRNPQREIHLYELGYAQDVEVEVNGETQTQTTALPHDRLAVILAELGGPAPEELTADGSTGWSLEMAPGRPNAYLEPKAYEHDPATGAQTLLPIRAKAGVTLHLLPDAEPGADDSTDGK